MKKTKEKDTVKKKDPTFAEERRGVESGGFTASLL